MSEQEQNPPQDGQRDGQATDPAQAVGSVPSVPSAGSVPLAGSVPPAGSVSTVLAGAADAADPQRYAAALAQAVLNPERTPEGLPEGLMRAEQLPDRMGITITDWNPDRMVATMPVSGNRQPYGLLHGGASCVLAETLGSVAAAIHAGPERSAVGLEINATHHRAARDGLVTAVCTPLHRGRSVATYEIAISDDHDRRVCTARLTCLIRQSPPGTPTP